MIIVSSNVCTMFWRTQKFTGGVDTNFGLNRSARLKKRNYNVWLSKSWLGEKKGKKNASN